MLLVLTCLYVAAALVIPDTAVGNMEGLKVAFESHGRWAVFTLGVYVFLGRIVNVILYDSSIIPQSVTAWFSWILLILAAMYPFTSKRKTQAFITVIWFIVVLCVAWNRTPSY
jgi:asparagine N-glycosylation enzyme membrane subunit Stt3